MRNGTCEYFSSTTTTAKITTSSQSISFACNFEIDFCGWSPNNDTPSQLWTRQNGQNGKYGSAPLTDNTYKNSQGYYGYINSSQNIESVAILKSTKFNYLNSDTCFEFFYQLGGPINSALVLSLVDDSNRTELWRRLGNRADVWSHAYVKIEQFDNGMKWLQFEGNISKTYNGYLAIDDIQLILGQCPSRQFCDFENDDRCGYQDDVTANFNWRRQKGSAIGNTGPKYDHTYQTSQGYYMFIFSSAFNQKGIYEKINYIYIWKNKSIIQF